MNLHRRLHIFSLAAILASAVILSGCYSTTMIHSRPSGARVTMDGERHLGNTPLELTEMVWVWTNHNLVLQKSGFDPAHVQLKNDGMQLAPIFACVCTGGLLLPVMFVSKYEPQLVVELNREVTAHVDVPLREDATLDFR